MFFIDFAIAFINYYYNTIIRKIVFYSCGAYDFLVCQFFFCTRSKVE